jgi:acetyl esterase/lipase
MGGPENLPAQRNDVPLPAPIAFFHPIINGPPTRPAGAPGRGIGQGQLSAELDKHGKAHEFHTYDGAGHAFFAVDRPAYRVEAAMDGWQKIFDFFGRTLSA